MDLIDEKYVDELDKIGFRLKRSNKKHRWTKNLKALEGAVRTLFLQSALRAPLVFQFERLGYYKYDVSHVNALKFIRVADLKYLVFGEDLKSISDRGYFNRFSMITDVTVKKISSTPVPIRQEIKVVNHYFCRASRKPGKAKPKKQQKAKGGKKPSKKGKPAKRDPSSLVFRAGLITDIKPVEGSDSLYVETVDFGDEKRIIASGLRKYVKAEDLLNKTHMFLVNIKPKKLPVGGIISNGMIMCPSTGEGDKRVVKLLDLGKIEMGSQITFKGFDQEKFNPKEFKVPNSKVLKAVLPGFQTNADGVLVWKDAEASCGDIKVTSPLLNAHVG